MAAPLPLGFSGLHELLDIWTECGVDPSKIIRNLTVNLPNGIRINSMDPIALNDSILQFQVISACYKIVPLVSLGVNRIESSIKELLSHSSIQRTRRGKTYDLRPLIISISIEAHQKETNFAICTVLKSQEGATGRPDEVMAAMNFDPFEFAFCRTCLNLSST